MVCMCYPVHHPSDACGRFRQCRRFSLFSVLANTTTCLYIVGPSRPQVRDREAAAASSTLRFSRSHRPGFQRFAEIMPCLAQAGLARSVAGGSSVRSFPYLTWSVS